MNESFVHCISRSLVNKTKQTSLRPTSQWNPLLPRHQVTLCRPFEGSLVAPFRNLGLKVQHPSFPPTLVLAWASHWGPTRRTRLCPPVLMHIALDFYGQLATEIAIEDLKWEAWRIEFKGLHI